MKRSLGVEFPRKIYVEKVSLLVKFLAAFLEFTSHEKKR